MPPALCASRLFFEFVGSLFSFEFPVLRTVAHLLTRGPSAVANDWIRGRRTRYLSPIKFVLLVGVVVALLYEPLQTLHRRWAGVDGVAIYEAGLARWAPGYAAFVCVLLLLPIAAVTHGIALLLGVRRGWLAWYVLGLYVYGIGIGIQLAMDVSTLPFASPYAFRTAQALLPAVGFAVCAGWFVERSGVWRGMLAVGLGQIVVFACIVGVRELFMMGS